MATYGTKIETEKNGRSASTITRNASVNQFAML